MVMNNNKRKYKMREGYVALITAIIVTAVMGIIGLSLSLASVTEGQVVISDNKSFVYDQVVESCVNDVLVRHYLKKDISDTIVLPIGTCDVTTTVTNPDANTTVTVYAVSYDNEGYSKTLEATVIQTATETKTYIKEK